MESDILVHILDGREKPTNLPFALLKNITGNFSEGRVVGQGGFAIVYKGVLPNGGVAVKRIRNNHSIDEKLFYREVDSLLTINHQNVVRFLGFCASTEQTAIKIEGLRQHIYAEIRERLLCFEYISNGSLKNHITDELRGLEWNTRYQIIKGICEGLHHLHKEKHIYHMDLKPANILLDNQMRPKITDFGLSRLDEKSETMSEDRCGSLGYCAPEYLLNGKMSFKSDMFSLGIVITELVTGEKGIPDNNKNNVLRKWRHRWKKTGKETALVYQQVAKCMEIGLLCQEIDPSKRPFIWDMIHDIREMEGANGKFSDACGYTFGQISPYSEDDMLGVEPLELHFAFEINKQISSSLKLTNQSDAYIAFNIQKMSPLPYRMQPNKGIVPPQSKCSVDVTLHPQDKAPWDMQRADEFIVWSTKVNGPSAEDITINMFNKESGVVDAMNLDVVFHEEESTMVSKELTLHSITEHMSNINLDGSVGAEAQHVRETFAQWGPGDSPNSHNGAKVQSRVAYPWSGRQAKSAIKRTRKQKSIFGLFWNPLEEANPSKPYLPTITEKPGSSFSEAAEDDPLPGIKDLRITGEAFPGRELQASGFSIDGTTSCNFEWVRHLEDGSVRFIEGARQPNYLVTADDVDTLLVIEVQPLDDRKRKGEVVKVYANDQAKITCDPETKELIKKTLEAGHVSYQVQLPQVRFLDMWEPAVLAIKREGYIIKCNGQRGVVIREKFQQATAINIPSGYERATELVIVSADGVEYNLQPAENMPPRDTIVLVLRLFRSMAVEERRRKMASSSSRLT